MCEEVTLTVISGTWLLSGCYVHIGKEVRTEKRGTYIGSEKGSNLGEKASLNKTKCWPRD